ncbi:hypothetical protein [Caulobacter sp. UNC279MFTsu5.1]|uniref:hypothetical protein n=1 Tax=Caulobacter sp. UNC279MFTsu5.1 TaxID=1502775 RepID=UPI0008ED6479|nr:hypothetical protein [Caulobacter sp. UNC279MFTsu5.1]SFK48909.1 hypothetical protein SAMN02799626_04438 [Caulobacter sp. UNC279MFTsu5.1]
MAETARTPLVMGEVFRDAGQVLARCGLILLPLSAALVFTGTAGAAWLRQHALVVTPGFADSAAGLAFVSLTNGVINWLAMAAPQSLFIAAASWTVAQVLEGGSPTAGQTLSQGLRLFLPVLAVQALYLLGAMAGALLLVVPGIILALMWILAPSALIVERLGAVRALKRSRALTKGHRWALLGLTVFYTLVVVALEWVIFQITTPGMSFVRAANAPINAYGVAPLLTALAAPLSVAIMTTIYMHLSKAHRGSADLTAEVFA